MTALGALQNWSARHWLTAAIGSVVVALAVGLPTDVIPNPVFGRPIDVTWWSYPALAVTALLGGLLIATYLRSDESGDLAFDDDLDAGAERQAKTGGFAGLLSFFAVGCPVCNKIVLIALGTTGARQWFEPLQPYLAAVSLALLAYALWSRLNSTLSCPVPIRSRS